MEMTNLFSSLTITLVSVGFIVAAIGYVMNAVEEMLRP